MMSRINFIKGNTLSEKISNLDFSNTYHILWIYKNISEIHKTGFTFEELEHVIIKDFTIGLSVYEDISQVVLRSYNKEEVDPFFTTTKSDSRVLDSNTIYYLCIPIMDTCLKQVVDLFTYIYKIEKDFTNINRLIEKYKTRKDILIELSLLKLRLTENNNNLLDNKLIDNNKLVDNYIDDNNKLVDNHIDDNNKVLDNLIENININPSLTSLLLEYEESNLNFFIENICIFLTYKDDQLLKSKLINYLKSGYKHLIIKNITKEVYLKIKDHIEINEELLKKGIYDYPYFVKWSKTCFTNLSVLKINDFVEISRLLIEYYRREENKEELKGILNSLLKLNINYVSEQIRINILNDIHYYYSDIQDSNIQDCDLLKDIILKASECKVLRLILVKKLGVLKHFNQEEKDLIIKNLFSNYDLNWRYKQVLIEECIKYREVIGFKDMKWIEEFENDKVYFIRDMVKRIKNELDIKESIINDKVDSKESLINDKVDSKESLINDKVDSKELIINDKVDSKELIINDKVDSNILESKPLEHIKDEEINSELINNEVVNNEVVNNEIIEEINNEEIFEKLKNNVKNKVKSIEEKIVFVSEKKNKSE